MTDRADADEPLELVSEDLLDGDAEEFEDDSEVIDALPVLAEVRELQGPLAGGLGAVQAAAVAATGFVAGAATLALARRYGTRRLERLQRELGGGGALVPSRPGEMLPLSGTRTYLVHVHLVRRPSE